MKFTDKTVFTIRSRKSFLPEVESHSVPEIDAADMTDALRKNGRGDWSKASLLAIKAAVLQEQPPGTASRAR